MYALKYDATIAAVWDSLPPSVSARLSDVLASACTDPFTVTVPYGEDDGIMRMLVLDEVLVVIYLGHQTKTLHIYQIDYLG
ncbi:MULTISPECIES: hypothetical protein [Streptomyces]|uniref:Type II toxin-antitoxin system RelE/ParE family toxin n=3 Tax=Streptomyces TaxID=1883 RepID=A0A3S9PQJ9_STRLT|nr:hypothetical protein [Streptomyces luteoverticillatus]AZQ74692.1 hypothetical protein EKH77_28885 [Streptomyces luteoverticillatus]